MRLMLDNNDPILVDVEALRRVKPDVAIDLTRAPSSRKGLAKEEPAKNVGNESGAITLEAVDPLAAIIALARRKYRR